jgi:hypothetical protein
MELVKTACFQEVFRVSMNFYNEGGEEEDEDEEEVEGEKLHFFRKRETEKGNR